MMRLGMHTVVWLVMFAPFLAAAEDAAPVSISNLPQLFLDDHLVRAVTNLERVVHHPVKHPANPLIVRELPWERRLVEIYGTVLYDPEGEKYRCWYLANEHKNGIPDNPAHPATAEYFTCYAESSDGIRWHKPMVGPEPFGLHTSHNIVIPGTHGFCVLPTPDDPDPNRRYKGVGGRLFGFSPDGIHWDLRDWGPAVGKNDTSSCVVHWRGEYLAYVRTQVDDPDWPTVMRGVGLSLSPDFEHWTPKETIFKTDQEDGYPWCQPYGMAVTPYGDVLIGIVWLLHLDHAPGNNSLGHQDAQLVVSRDGRTWRRVANRALFLGPTPGAWDRGRVFPGTTILVKDDEVRIYYTGVDTRHGEGWGTMGIGLATLPADRFVSLRQWDPALEGILDTCLMDFTGSRLLVNAEVGDGDLQVEALDDDGTPIPGFERHRSRLVRHDRLRHRVAWQDTATSGAAEHALPRGPLSLRFVLRKGDLFAFQLLK